MAIKNSRLVRCFSHQKIAPCVWGKSPPSRHVRHVRPGRSYAKAPDVLTRGPNVQAEQGVHKHLLCAEPAFSFSDHVLRLPVHQPKIRKISTINYAIFINNKLCNIYNINISTTNYV